MKERWNTGIVQQLVDDMALKAINRYAQIWGYYAWLALRDDMARWKGQGFRIP